MATHARPTPLGTAVRRVVVTPTFAAGLGVVIAAGMAYPMTKTVISYGGTPPAGGNRCLVDGCVPSGEGLATASPGQRLKPTAPVLGDGVLAADPVMQYETLRQWQSGFFGKVTITNPGGSAPADWELRLGYDSAHIVGVWGGSWSPSGDHAVLVTPYPGQGTSHGWGDSVQVVVAVSGPAGPPSECDFNGRTCQSGQADGPSQEGGRPSQDRRPQFQQDGQHGGHSPGR